MKSGMRKGYDKARSYCRCGHLGDGTDSEHADRHQPGHGACLRCNCERFTWVGFTADYMAYRRERFEVGEKP